MMHILETENENRDKTAYSIALELGFSSDSGLNNFSKRRFNNTTFTKVRNNPAKIKEQYCAQECAFNCAFKCAEE